MFSTTPKQVAKVYKIDEAAKELNLGFGRNTLYAILKNLKIVNEHNAPADEYVENGYLILKVPVLPPNKNFRNHPVTLVNGDKGLNFIREVVEEYLKTNQVLKQKRSERMPDPTDEIWAKY